MPFSLFINREFIRIIFFEFSLNRLSSFSNKLKFRTDRHDEKNIRPKFAK